VPGCVINHLSLTLKKKSLNTAQKRYLSQHINKLHLRNTRNMKKKGNVIPTKIQNSSITEFKDTEMVKSQRI
jgi:hypothetical protein